MMRVIGTPDEKTRVQSTRPSPAAPRFPSSTLYSKFGYEADGFPFFVRYHPLQQGHSYTQISE